MLGDAHDIYYVGKGLKDYAIIEDFQNKDQIQLHGNSNQYELNTKYTLGSNNGTAIFLHGTHELIGFVQGVTDISLTSNDFSYVGVTHC
ncbi:hypothetical protein NIES806_17090 [Dolichospermum compactum NIES-806]|uniref:Uncharacterized protein n=1 Tax=Dolichospermum compactum NIES-806 TaxID=1973481 RepID=A0A1Z4V1X0_9CYAN|nr:hypothetical protein NIES806_17090 [Dolichospermum compactum NIES-806]